MIVPGARYEYVERMDDGAKDMRYNALIIHTNGGKVPTSGDLYDWWQHGASAGVGATFQVSKAGTIFEYLTTERYTGHAWDANHWSWGCENEDDGNNANPFTDAQLQAMYDIAIDLKVPGREIACPGPASGVGWHQKCPTWNQSNHDCPGPTRVHQITSELIPMIAGTKPAPGKGDGSMDLPFIDSAALAYVNGQRLADEDFLAKMLKKDSMPDPTVYRPSGDPKDPNGRLQGHCVNGYKAKRDQYARDGLIS